MNMNDCKNCEHRKVCKEITYAFGNADISCDDVARIAKDGYEPTTEELLEAFAEDG